MPQKKVVLITGCSNPAGIGFSSARLLARRGHHVWATVRDMTKAPALSEGFAPESLSVAELDVRDEMTVQQAATAMLERHGRIDTLINNAGFGLIGPVENLSLAQIKDQIGRAHV